MRALSPLLPLFLPLALGACSAQTTDAGDFTGEQKTVVEVIDDFEDAAAKDDADRICSDILTKALANRIAAGKDCGQVVSDALDDADDTKMDVKKVTVTGTSARVTVSQKRSGKDVDVSVSLAKDGARWRVSELPQPQR